MDLVVKIMKTMGACFCCSSRQEEERGKGGGGDAWLACVAERIDVLVQRNVPLRTRWRWRRAGLVSPLQAPFMSALAQEEEENEEITSEIRMAIAECLMPEFCTQDPILRRLLCT